MTDKRYQPQSDNITEDDDIQEHLLDSIRTNTYRTKHPQINKLTIPTPKMTSNTTNQYESSNWRDNETIEWIKDGNETWKINKLAIEQKYTENATAEKWTEMVKGFEKKDRIKKMQSARDMNKIQICTEKVQSDTGANQAVTNNKECLYAYNTIEPYPIGGVKADEVAIVCTGQGLLPWESTEGNIIMVRTMYSEEVEGTIISPTTVVQQNQDKYHGFTIESDCDNGRGTLRLNGRDEADNCTYTMALENGLWFHNHNDHMKMTASIKKMNVATYNNLWHGRLGHAGDKIMSEIHNHVKGIKKPIRMAPLFKCAACLPNKMCKVPHTRKNKARTLKEKRAEKLCQAIQNTLEKMSMDDPEATDDKEMIKGHAGQHFHMDFGFVRGT